MKTSRVSVAYAVTLIQTRSQVATYIPDELGCAIESFYHGAKILLDTGAVVRKLDKGAIIEGYAHDGSDVNALIWA